MPQYKYKAIDEFGKTVTGIVDVRDENDAEVQLHHRDLDPISIKPVKSYNFSFGNRRVPRRDLIAFTFYLEQQMLAGIPILEGLHELQTNIDNRTLRAVTAGLIEKVEGGMRLSEAMAEYSGTFDPVFISLISAGESSGKLSQILNSISENLKWEDEITSQAKKAATYPIFVAVAVLAVVIALMVFLVPELVKFIITMNQELPWHTLALIFVSDTIRNFGHYIFLTVAGTAAVLYVVYQQSSKMKFVVDGIKLRLWLVGAIQQKIIMSRFTYNFALLYESGITVMDCLKIGEGIVGNRVIADAISKAGQSISEGEGISKSFEKTNIFPKLVLRMLSVGESTGALETSLLNISYFYNRDVKEALDKLQSLMGPVMTAILGAILAWVILSVFGPIYNTLTTVTI